MCVSIYSELVNTKVLNNYCKANLLQNIYFFHNLSLQFLHSIQVALKKKNASLYPEDINNTPYFIQVGGHFLVPLKNGTFNFTPVRHSLFSAPISVLSLTRKWTSSSKRSPFTEGLKRGIT